MEFLIFSISVGCWIKKKRIDNKENSKEIALFHWKIIKIMFCFKVDWIFSYV
jgi:hypothetical protein